jgi:4'-phosphopantetheinyl transferase
MLVRSWPEWHCVVMLSPSRNKPGADSSRLWLAGGITAADRGGAAHSGLARELLSELARQLGMDCPAQSWSSRGQGKPRHANLPIDWYAGISHRKGRVIVGLADCPFGLDLERALPRHANRLGDLIDTLPESRVRAWIRAHPYPSAAFYQAWTAYEALFKLTDLTSDREPASSSLRLHSRNARRKQFMAWQDKDWTLAVVAERKPQLLPDPSLIFPGLTQVPSNFAV